MKVLKQKTKDILAVCWVWLYLGRFQLKRVVELKWAVERGFTFASSYAKNNRHTKVFYRDFNKS